MAIQVKVIEPKVVDGPCILETKIDGMITADDYETLVSEIDVFLFKNKIRILFELGDFYGWASGALWEDTKFASRSFHNIERVALVGEKHWARGMMLFCKKFGHANIRYYDSAVLEDGKGWILEND